MPDPSPSADTPNPSRCKARSRRSGGQCRAYPVHGALVCSVHGGRAPQVRSAAGRRQAQEVAERAVVTYGLPREIDPNSALLEEVQRTAGHVGWLGEMIRTLDPAALAWGKTQEVDKQASEFAGMDTTFAAVPPVWLELYLRERRHLVEVCRIALQAGVEERQVRLAEQQGHWMADIFRRVLDALGLTSEQRAQVPALLAAAVAEITGRPELVEMGVR